MLAGCKKSSIFAKSFIRSLSSLIPSKFKRHPLPRTSSKCAGFFLLFYVILIVCFLFNGSIIHFIAHTSGLFIVSFATNEVVNHSELFVIHLQFIKQQLGSNVKIRSTLPYLERIIVRFFHDCHTKLLWFSFHEELNAFVRSYGESLCRVIGKVQSSRLLDSNF